MTEEISEKEVIMYLKKYFSLLDNNFKASNKKRIPYDELYEIIVDLNSLINKYNEFNPQKCSILSTKKYIPLLDLLIKLDNDSTRSQFYLSCVKNAYRISARTSLKSYMIYREWEDKYSDKFFAPRYEIMEGYIHYLEEITFNPNFKMLIANMPSGYGKTFPEKISEAWNFGVDPTGTVLSLCSNEGVVEGGSRLVIDEIKSEHFGEVFPEMAFDENDKNYFLKETAGEWKLKQCRLAASYYAKTTQGRTIGYRASQRLHIDDLYKNYLEAMSQKLNEEYYNTYLTTWKKRFVQNKPDKTVITGTLWASGDFIALMIALMKKQHKFHKHPKYKYTWISEDESVAIIQVPALDYTTGLSTCPELRTTKELEQERLTMDEYLWETNFQQRPTDPEALFFSYNKLRTYETIPKTDYIGTYAVIDATRKSGKDFFAMPIFTKVPNENGYDYYLKDCLFTKTATKDMYEEVCRKIIDHHIIELVIESNVTSELKQNIETILKGMGVSFCVIKEKYNCENKEVRIEMEKGNIVRKLVFPIQGMYGIQSDMGKFMNNLTLYNTNGRNPNDDAPDACGMFCHEIIDGGSYNPIAKPIKRPF